MKIRVYRSKITYPLIPKKKDVKETFYVAERKEDNKLTAFSLMSLPLGK